MKRLLNTLSNTRARGRLYGARALRRDRSGSRAPGCGVFSVIGDVLGGVALFALLFGVASLGG